MRYEYTVIPAPNRGEKTKGAKTPVDRFSVALTAELNRMASEGWDYVRAETLPSEERKGLTGRNTVYHNVLIFRRAAAGSTDAAAIVGVKPQPEYPVSATPLRAPEKTPEPPQAAAPRPIDHTSVSDATTATPPAPRVGPSGE